MQDLTGAMSDSDGEGVMHSEICPAGTGLPGAVPTLVYPLLPHIINLSATRTSFVSDGRGVVAAFAHVISS